MMLDVEPEKLNRATPVQPSCHAISAAFSQVQHRILQQHVTTCSPRRRQHVPITHQMFDINSTQTYQVHERTVESVERPRWPLPTKMAPATSAASIHHTKAIQEDQRIAGSFAVSFLLWGFIFHAILDAKRPKSLKGKTAKQCPWSCCAYHHHIYENMKILKILISSRLNHCEPQPLENEHRRLRGRGSKTFSRKGFSSKAAMALPGSRKTTCNSQGRGHSSTLCNIRTQVDSVFILLISEIFWIESTHHKITTSWKVSAFRFHQPAIPRTAPVRSSKGLSTKGFSSSSRAASAPSRVRDSWSTRSTSGAPGGVLEAT